MKAEIESITTGFTPFGLKLYIETSDEAVALWHFFNDPNGCLRRIFDNHPKINPDASYPVWNMINKELKRQGVI